MLTVITLNTINKIFDEVAEVKLSNTAKCLYLNCLTHQFKDKKPTVANAVAFEIFISDIKNYQNFEAAFQQLHKAKLVVIDNMFVRFQNCWGKFIDRTRLDKVSPDEFVAGFSFDKAGKFKNDMLTSGSLLELTQMKHKITEQETKQLIQLFVKEQDTLEKKYSSLQDCTRHFIYWLPNNIKKDNKTYQKNGQYPKSVANSKRDEVENMVNLAKSILERDESVNNFGGD